MSTWLRVAIRPRQRSIEAEGGPLIDTESKGERLLNALEKHSTLFHVVSAAVLAGVAGYEFIQGDPPASYVEPMFIFGIVGMASLVIAVTLSVGRKRRDEAAKQVLAERDAIREKFEVAAKKINDILAIDYAHCMYVAGLACDERPRDGAFIQEVRSRLNAYIVEILSHSVALFTIYSGSQCAASLKMLSTNRHEKGTAQQAVSAADRPQYVYTYARDPDSRIRRSVTDHTSGLDIYEWTGHAAFAEIMHSPEQHGYFCSNDLQGLGAKYWNTNPRWRDLYAAVAVCALKNPANDNVVEAMGFLCIDNMSGGFDVGTCREVLESVASIIYYTFRTTEEVLNSQVEVEGHG